MAEGGQKHRSVETPAQNAFIKALTEKEQAWLCRHPVIRIVQDPGWPPIEFTDTSGEPAGMSWDYLNLIEQRLGVKFERMRNLSCQEAYARLKRWEIDMTTSVAVTPEQAVFWAFTKPYMKIPIVIVARVDVTYIAGMRELAGKKVAVYVNNQCMAVRKDWVILAGILQKALYSISESERNAIYRKWLPIRYEQGFNYTLFRQALVDFAVILLALLFWNRRLTREIRHRKNAERALGEKENLLSESQRIAHIGSWSYAIGGQLTWSDETYRIYGVSPDTFTPDAESFINLIHPDDRPAMQRWVTECLAGERPGDLEFRAIMPDGAVRFISGRGELQKDTMNKPAYMAGTAQDITERKLAEEKLLKSEEKFRTIFDMASDGILLVDPVTKKFIQGNTAICSMLGYGKEEIKSLTIYDIHPQEDIPHVLDEFNKQLNREKVFADDLPVLRKDGSIFYADIGAGHITIEGLHHLIGVFRDITSGRAGGMEFGHFEYV